MLKDKPINEVMEKDLGELEAILRRQIALQEQILPLLHAKRVALAGANHRRVTELCQQENVIIQAASEVEKRRLIVVARLTLALDGQAPKPLPMRELAERLPEPARGRLLVLRTQVRQRIEACHQEVGVARRATEKLVRHMQGLIQTIGTAVTGVGTYTQMGTRPKAATAMSTFNTTA